MSEPHKRSRHPKYKTSYRVRNWPDSEESLRARGDVTLWVSQEAMVAWIPTRCGNRGGQPLYSDVAIDTGLRLRLIFHQALRQTEGFLATLLKLMGVDLPCPDHTTFSRRNHAVEVRRHSENLPAGPLNFIVDSTGLKIFGQGEWHANKHGRRQPRRWRKLHIGVDGEGWIHASKITDDHEQDPCQVPDLLDQVEREINSFVGDGIYDRDSVYEAVKRHSHRATLIVPPRKDAVRSSRANTASSQRHRHVQRILEMGRSKWKRESGYYTSRPTQRMRYSVTRQRSGDGSGPNIITLRKRRLSWDVPS